MGRAARGAGVLPSLIDPRSRAAHRERNEIARAHHSRSRSLFYRVIQTFGDSTFGHHDLERPPFTQAHARRSNSLFREHLHAISRFRLIAICSSVRTHCVSQKLKMAAMQMAEKKV